MHVQRAADVVFDHNPSAPLSVSPSNETPTTVESFDIDDSEQQGLLGNGSGGRGFRRVVSVHVLQLR